MSARLPPRQLNNAVLDAALASLPVNDSGLTQLTPIKEHMDRHGQSEIPHGDVHSSISDDVVWHLVDKQRQRLVHSTSTLLLNTTEQSDRASCRAVNCNGLNAVIDRLGMELRRAVGTRPAMGQVF